MARPLRIGGVPEHFNLPWRLAAESGAFQAAGLDVEFVECPGGTGQMTGALRDGELEAALVLTEGAVADALNHDRNRLCGVWVASPLVWGIHVAHGSTLRRIGDMRGKRIAISRYGSGSHLIPIVDAAARGWDTEAMHFVVINDIAGARRALARNKADVFFWERHMTQPLVDAGEFRRLGVREVPWPAFVMSARKHVLARRGEALRKALAIAQREARNFKRRASTPALIAETYGIRLPDVKRWLAHVRWASGSRPPVAALRRASDALLAQGVVSERPATLYRVWHRR